MLKIDLKNKVSRVAVRVLAVHTALIFLVGTFIFRLLGRGPDSATEGATPKAILVVRLDEIGDMVMTTPFLRELRLLYPDTFITLVVKPGIAALFELCPYVNEVLTFNQSGRSLERPFVLPVRALQFVIRSLWHRRYDIALLPRWDADYYYATFLAFFSGAPRRVGFSEKVIGRKSLVNQGYDCLLTERLIDEAPRSEIAHSLKMLHTLGSIKADDRQELWISTSDRVFAAQYLAETKRESDLLIGMGPSGGHSVLKQWPLENFAELGRRLHERYGATLLLFGGPGEQAMGQTLAGQIGPSALNSIGETSLRQTAALMELCQVYIGNDSGPTHMAAAMGIPVVAIFGSSCRHRFQPGGKTSLVWRELPCSPCQVSGHEDRCHVCIYGAPLCLTQITVEEVENAVAAIISAAKTNQARIETL